MSSAESLDVLHALRSLVYLGVVLVAFIQWRRRPGPPTAWLLATFASVTFALVAGELLPQDSDLPAVVVTNKAAIAGLVLFPYCLYRFMTSLIAPIRWIRVVASIVAAGVAVGAFFLPDIPEGEARPAWLQMYIAVVLVQWVLLSGLVAVRLWRAGRGQPVVARRRMRTMSAGAAGLALAISVAAEVSGSVAADVLVELLVMGAGPLMAIGFAPPYVVRVAWRRREDAAVREAALSLMEATTMSEVAETLLPHARRLLGASLASLEDDDGEVVASSGVGRGAGLTGTVSDGSSATAEDLDGAVISVPMNSGWLRVVASPLAPFFGTDELSRLKELAALADLAIARNRLLDDQRRVAAVVESSDDAIIAKDLEGTITSWNRGAERLYGYRPEEVVGRPISVLIPPGYEDDINKIMGSVRRGESMRHYETKRRKKSGDIIDVSLTASPVTDVRGDLAGVSVIARDVTERNRMEQQIRASEVQLAAAQRTGQIGSWSWDVTTDHVAWSEELYRIMGLSPKEVERLTSSAFFERVHPDDRPKAEEATASTFATHEPVKLEYRVLRPDGSERVVEARVAVEVDGGVPVSMTGTVQDVTERKKAEAEAVQRQQLLTAIFETSPDIVATITSTLELRYVNPAAERVLGYGLQELFGENSLHWVHPDDLDVAAELLRLAFGSHGAGEDRLRVRTAAGEWIWLDIRMRRMTSGSDTAVVMASDVTTQVRLEEGLTQARDEANQANLAKSAFLSRMSHELRTPLNAVLGFTQLLGMDPLTPEQKESTDEVLKAGKHLLDLIDEVLDISRIEAGKLRLSLEPVDAVETVRDCISLLTPLADQEGVAVMLDHSDSSEAPTFVTADRQRLKQVLLNLISNAIKYNRESGNVRVSFMVTDERLRIDVADSGYGIPAEQMALLFVPFERLGAEGSGVGGTGLGLALSKPLVEAMGGTLSVSSRPREGSTFSVELELAQVEAGSAGEGASRATEGTGPPTIAISRTILYIEDNLSNLRLVERLVAQKPGVSLITAMQGGMGVTLARDHRPDLVLLDLDLPDISGEQVLARLLSDPRTVELPVVVISADASPGQAGRFVEAGARGYLTKPLDVTRFFALIDEFCPLS